MTTLNSYNSQSFRSRLLRTAFYIFKRFIKLKAPSQAYRLKKRSDRPVPPVSLLRGINAHSHKLCGRNVFSLSPARTKSQKKLIFFHGGGYVLNFSYFHWKLITRLVKMTGYTIIAPDYPLLPAIYKERLNMGLQLYRDLLKKDDAADIVFMGDSSGGNLALSLAQLLAHEGMPQPAQIILLSPWLDVTMSNPAIHAIGKHDPVLSAGDNTLGKLHAGDRDLTDYLVSPLYGSLKDLGKLSLFTGTDDILNPDARLLYSKAKAEDTPLNFFEYEHMIHDWILFPIPEASHAFKQIVQLLSNNNFT
ncbi:Acetyl esterase/lipase [bacterium A37T11]|nr:Acetyl esterase/lipase [bacterium A37T11]